MVDLAGAKVWGLIAAAGSGRRMASDVPKQYLDLAGVPVIMRSIDALAALPAVDGIVVGIAPDDDRFSQLGARGSQRIRGVYSGGDTRAQTVLNGLTALESFAAPEDWVMVHDAARPFVTTQDLRALIDAVGSGDTDGAVLGWPLADSLARVKHDGDVESSVSREGLWRTATPQMFRLNQLKQALVKALESGKAITDELAAMRTAGFSACLVECSRQNFKITTTADLAEAQTLLSTTMQSRVGSGFDVHAFEAGRRLVLGGVEIEFDRGLAGHSDADVALHALCDALLGAAALGDIGQHFPDSDAAWAGADSRVLLRSVVDKIRAQGLRPGNVDVTIIAQAPRVSPYVGQMVENIAADLGVAPDVVNVKATTTEGLGFTGRGEGIAAQAIAVLESI